MKGLLKSALAALVFAHATAALGILAIDYGASDFKASFVGAGTPFDVLYNKDSKRKTPSVVTLHGEDRLVGADAASMATRYPLESFPSVKMLLGHSEEDPLSVQHAHLFQAKRSTDEKSRIILQKPDKANFLCEEILAMQFAAAKEMALLAAKTDRVFDTVITVPFYFNQIERQAVLDAAELAGLNVLGLVNDGSAVAVNYAMTRTFPSPKETPEYHLFYDAGASSTRATVVAFTSHSIPESPTSKFFKNHTQIDVRGVGWQKAVGGFAIDRNIRELLVQQFEQTSANKLSQPVRENARAMAKLLKEASRVKHVLSANVQAPSRIENLAEDIDFKGTIAREDVENASADLSTLFAQPIADALTVANLTAADLSSVILVGGASRIPMVQAAVKTVIPEEKIAQNLNADEAAVLGAVLYGAGLSAQFRTKDIRVSDLLSYDVEVAYDADKPKEDGSSRVIKSLMFAANGRLSSRKTLTLKKTENFTLSLSHRTADSGDSLSIAQYHLKGINTTALNLTETELQNCSVKCTLEATESGLVQITEALFVPPEAKSQQSMTDRIKNLFGSKDKTGADAANETVIDLEMRNALETMLKTSEKVSLTVETSTTATKCLSKSELAAAKKRLRDIEQAEIRKKKREEARNVLEGYIYRVRDHLADASFGSASTENERHKLSEKLEAASEWIWDGGETAPTTELRTRKSDLEKLVQPILARIAESVQRPKLIETFERLLQVAEKFSTEAAANRSTEIQAEQPSRHTESDLTSLAELLKSTASWFTEARTKQEKLPLNIDPVLLSADLNRRTKAITSEIDRLRVKKAPRKPKTTSASSSATVETTSTEANASETATETPKRDEL